MLTKRKQKKGKGIVCVFRVIVVFCFCVFAWIFFASNSLNDALYIVTNMFNGISQPGTYLHDGFFNIGISKVDCISLTISILILALFDWMMLKKNVIEVISAKKTLVRWCIYVIFTLWMIFNIPATSSTEFIYFQF